MRLADALNTQKTTTAQKGESQHLVTLQQAITLVFNNCYDCCQRFILLRESTLHFTSASAWSVACPLHVFWLRRIAEWGWSVSLQTRHDELVNEIFDYEQADRAWTNLLFVSGRALNGNSSHDLVHETIRNQRQQIPELLQNLDHEAVQQGLAARLRQLGLIEDQIRWANWQPPESWRT